MDDHIFKQKRNSFIEIGKIYFWTATINNWQKLLLKDDYKNIIMESLQYLSEAGKIDVFAFVIMPNHIHLIWRINEPNGKETAQGSFLKYTAHVFKKKLLQENKSALDKFMVNASNKVYEFWQRDSLAIELYSKEVAFQKLAYIHNNPCTDYWQLVKDRCFYKYSTASYYELGVIDYDFVKDLRDEF
jgi:putative transposase